MDETYIRVSGQWKNLYRAVDKDGNTIDFLLTAKRDQRARTRQRQLDLQEVHHGYAKAYSR